MTAEPVVELDSAARTFRCADGLAGVREVSLRLGAGEYLAVVGPSGAGKTTLLNLVGLLERPTAGEVSFLGAATSTMPDRTVSRLRAAAIGFVFQSFHLIRHETALENVTEALCFDGRSSAARRAEATRALDRVGLRARLGHRPGELSGGEQQRVALARAIVRHPQLVVADEPTGNLDGATTGEVLGLLESFLDDGAALVVATHDLAVARRAHRRLAIDAGVARPW